MEKLSIIKDFYATPQTCPKVFIPLLVSLTLPLHSHPHPHPLHTPGSHHIKNWQLPNYILVVTILCNLKKLLNVDKSDILRTAKK